MGKLTVQADIYYNNKKKIDSIFGEDRVCPVDLNGGYVTEKNSKWGMDEATGKKVEQGMREQFGLQEPNEEYEY